MPSNSTKDLKLVHILWTIIVAAVLVGVAWGVMKNELINHGKAITEVKEKKVSKEVFDVYLEAQKQQTNTFVETVNRGFDKIDQRLENIENK
ncbi:hypothetical protein KAR91_20805 [Candidatus Pacearchaeota archaeon]|nr:hypothetical protein [Candidatus Pacearchaeota archaeon]